MKGYDSADSKDKIADGVLTLISRLRVVDMQTIFLLLGDERVEMLKLIGGKLLLPNYAWKSDYWLLQPERSVAIVRLRR